MSSSAVREISAREMDWSAGARTLWRRPLCVRNAAAEWRITPRLGFERLAKDFGDRRVSARKTTDASSRRTMSLAEYLEYARTTDDSEPYYLTSVPVSALDPALYALIPAIPAFENWLDLLPAEVRPEMCWMFVGPPQSGSGMHQDILGSSAWNALFEGRKRWTFAVPESLRRSGKAKSLTCIQRPGDVMYTPPTWFHEVVNEEPSIALTGNYLNASNVSAAIEWLASQHREDWVRMLRHLAKESKSRGGTTAGRT